MKLIIVGATGFVATECIRLALLDPDITSVVAVARRRIEAPIGVEGGGVFKSVVVEGYGESGWRGELEGELEGAAGCIWTVAITPSKSRNVNFEEVRRVCQDNTLAGLDAIYNAQKYNSSSEPSTPTTPATPSTPFRFIYMSGAASERDQSQKPKFMAQYCLMRGETENRVLAYAAERKGKMEACCIKPGLITQTGHYWRTIKAVGLSVTVGVPKIDVSELSKAMLEVVKHGWEREPLGNEECVELGRGVVGRGG